MLNVFLLCIIIYLSMLFLLMLCVYNHIFISTSVVNPTFSIDLSIPSISVGDVININMNNYKIIEYYSDLIVLEDVQEGDNFENNKIYAKYDVNINKYIVINQNNEMIGYNLILSQNMYSYLLYGVEYMEKLYLESSDIVLSGVTPGVNNSYKIQEDNTVQVIIYVLYALLVVIVPFIFSGYRVVYKNTKELFGNLIFYSIENQQKNTAKSHLFFIGMIYSMIMVVVSFLMVQNIGYSFGYFEVVSSFMSFIICFISLLFFLLKHGCALCLRRENTFNLEFSSTETY